MYSLSTATKLPRGALFIAFVYARALLRPEGFWFHVSTSDPSSNLFISWPMAFAHAYHHGCKFRNDAKHETVGNKRSFFPYTRTPSHGSPYTPVHAFKRLLTASAR